MAPSWGARTSRTIASMSMGEWRRLKRSFSVTVFDMDVWCQPPLTGGRNAIVSLSARRVSHGANSSLREATSEARNAASWGKRVAYRSKRLDNVVPSGTSTASSLKPVNSRTRPKNRTLIRRLAETRAIGKL